MLSHSNGNRIQGIDLDPGAVLENRIRNWPHAPIHRLDDSGIFMVTAGTYRKTPFFHSAERIEMLNERIFTCFQEFGWRLHAWAVLPNHYHLIARCDGHQERLSRLMGKIHMLSAKWINESDHEPGRKVWHQYWDNRITYEKAYLARLNYVNQNPVKHGLVSEATGYRWCSMAWFERNAVPSLVKTVNRFKIDQVNVVDDF
jgi:putative transposase